LLFGRLIWVAVALGRLAIQTTQPIMKPVHSTRKEEGSMSRPFIVAAVALAIVALAPEVTLAQAGTPTPDFVTPDPAECQVAPRSIESIAAALATPVAGTPTMATPAGDVAAGQPVDAETVETVMTLAREATACGNAGDYRRVFALYTDNGLRVFAADRGMAAEQIVGFLAATPVALPAEAWQGVRIRDVRVLADGRVTAFIDFLSPEVIGTVFVALVRDGDRYFVDSEVALPSAAATPTP
jgi:hypothetical protein